MDAVRFETVIKEALACAEKTRGTLQDEIADDERSNTEIPAAAAFRAPEPSSPAVSDEDLMMRQLWSFVSV